MDTQEYKTVPVRSARLIVDQTERLAALFMLEMYRQATADPSFQFRNSSNPRSEHCWTLACKVQELLTDTDPENAVAEVDDEEISASDADSTLKGYLVLQEGPSPEEVASRGFDTLDAAQSFCESAQKEGAYRTSTPIAVPLRLISDPAFESVAVQIAKDAFLAGQRKVT